MRIERAAGFPVIGQPGLYWLGQAGFWIETGKHRVLIDPYLSDSLALKYAGQANDHKRMMPPPINIDALPRPDLVLVTHAHTDHMDPMTLGPLRARFPDLPFVVPAAREAAARDRIGAEAHLILTDAGEMLEPVAGLKLTVFPAAHESLERDAHGRHPFLGYGMASNGLRIYHSGDSIPFPELAPLLAEFAPQIGLLPVNGRDAARLAAGIPGNFTLEEAITLAKGWPYLIPHHFDMFSFNTLDPALIEVAAAQQTEGEVRIIRPELGAELRIFP
ncbi:MAG: MBL fold metallo-hydrolase [Cypionkella sp.]